MRATIGAFLLAFMPAVSALSPDAKIQTTLEPSASGEWRVNFELSEEVTSLVFARGNGNYRKGAWMLTDDSFLLERFGKTDRIRRLDGQAFHRVSAELRPQSQKLSKDYTPFIFFSDGSVAVFTGQLIVGEPLTDQAPDFTDGANDTNTSFPAEASLKVSAGSYNQMIVKSELVEVSAELTLAEGEYLYFGSSETIDTPALTAVADPKMPAWLRKHLYESMAEIFDYYKQRLGPLPGEKPFMLVSYQQLEGGRTSFNGGVIGSQLAIELGLGEAIQDSPDERLFMARFFAHEAAHLWNNGRVVSSEEAGAWMHEGSAEAMAWLALRDLELYDNELVIKLFTSAANTCSGFLLDGPLKEAFRKEDYRAYYDCGATIALATDGLMRQRGGDLFDFWRILIETSEAKNGVYHASEYRSLAATFSPVFADELLTFTDELQDGNSAILELLRTGNVAAVSLKDKKIGIEALP